MALSLTLSLLLRSIADAAAVPLSRGVYSRLANGTARNIIFFQCDEMDGRVLDPRHPISKVAHMPNLEAMMARGVNFVGAYTNAPLCAPSRASMFTGRRSSSLQAWSNVKPLLADVSEWPPTRPDPNCVSFLGAERCLELGKKQNVSTTMNLAMAGLGYDVHLHGKMDTGGGPVMNPPTTVATGYHGTANWSMEHVMVYYPGDFLHSFANGADISKPVFAPLWEPNDWINTAASNPAPAGDWNTVDDCVKFLQDYREGDPPFFLYCSVENPHPPYQSNATWEAFIDLQELEASLDWTLETYLKPSEVHPADASSRNSMGVSETFNRTLAREMALAYHGACAMVDHMFGRVRAALRASQAADSTYVMFASDHGELHLEHRLVEKDSMYEASARVPLIVEGPGVPSGKREEDFVSLIDLFPTFLDMAQASTIPDALEGYSLAPYLGMTPVSRPRPDYIISEYLGEVVNTPQFMIRRGDLKLIVYGQEPPFQHYTPQLFNVTADPHEVRNIAQEPALAPVVAELREQLLSVVDYPSVVKTLAAENRELVRNWMSSYTESEWRAMVRAAYYKGNDDDSGKLLRWLHQEGEFAPQDVAVYM
eukprot:TRINITY_DN80324_c0_g1_i1.p1 TRINITY_DN80324_c0_g1~~TRINITY_DN80324_c0_g1_i1.p1  ORF type:complete len:662 (+),score=71.85 TRINITY_DN80324_c0_g1_i1:201-1988(+)